MNAKERYNRLKDLQTLATRLQVALIEEADLALAEVKKIERSVVESNRRVEALEDMVSWDGNQWDGLIADGTCWRRPTLRDLGKIIRVSGSTTQTENPAKLEPVELVGFTVVDGSPYYVCPGTKGEHVYWPHAWIQSEPCEEIKPLNGPCASIAVIKGSSPYKPGHIFTPESCEARFELGDRVILKGPDGGKVGVIIGRGLEDGLWRYSLDTVPNLEFFECHLEPVLHQVAKDAEGSK